MQRNQNIPLKRRDFSLIKSMGQRKARTSSHTITQENHTILIEFKEQKEVIEKMADQHE
jgi:hypothetical protein